VEYVRSLWKKIAPRLFRAMLGFWLVLGPFVVFLIRWQWYEAAFFFFLLIAAFVVVGLKCWLDGREYLKLLGADTFTALASVLIGGGVSGIIARFIHVRLHASMLFLPLVVVAGFAITEWYRERKAAVPAAPAGAPPQT
jgi:hypothetical protein